MAINVLVVDDSETVRAVICKTLEIAGIELAETHHANHGGEALEVMRNNTIDLVFSDINMPEMGGIEMISAMQSDAALKAIPVIVISTEGSKTRIDALKDQGVSAYIRKPFTPESVKATVDEVMGA